MTGPRITDKYKAKIDLDKQIAANYLYWEEKLPSYKIETQLRMGHATFDRLILPTFKDWREFRQRVGK